MRILACFIGAIIGAIGGTAAILLIAIFLIGDDFAGVFMVLMFLKSTLIATALIGGFIAFALFQRLRDRDTQKLRPKKVLVSLGVAISAAVILVASLFWIVRSNARPPSDQKLLSNFERHEATLNNLVEMVRAEKELIQINKYKTSSAISETRFEEYRKLLKYANVRKGVESFPVFHEIDFCCWDIGGAMSPDAAKGYAYCETAPAPEIQQNLDEYRPPSDDNTKVYRHIRGNWYLYYEYLGR